MWKIIYMVFGVGVLFAYSTASWLGVEMANSGSRSRLGMPFIYSGFHGGK